MLLRINSTVLQNISKLPKKEQENEYRHVRRTLWHFIFEILALLHWNSILLSYDIVKQNFLDPTGFVTDDWRNCRLWSLKNFINCGIFYCNTSLMSYVAHFNIKTPRNVPTLRNQGRKYLLPLQHHLYHQFDVIPSITTPICITTYWFIHQIHTNVMVFIWYFCEAKFLM